MSPCEEHSVKILHYLEGNLPGQELIDFQRHLESCANCRATLEAEQALSRVLHRFRRLYSAPAALHIRVNATVIEHSLATRSTLYEDVWHTLRKLLEPARPALRLKMLVPALLVMGLILAFVPNVMRQARASNFVETAVATHRSYLNGNLSLGLRSSSPELVTGWFESRVPFEFRLPNSQSPSDTTPAYHLAGASLVNYRGSPAALVTYEKQNERISLLIASNQTAVVAGGQEIRSGALTFHYRTDQGFKVVTWSTHGLCYALVSSVAGSARESCMVCHQDMTDHHKFKPVP
jgi:anti-sigma factor RsiW